MQEEKQIKFDRGRVSAYNGQTDLFCDFATVTQGGKQEVFYLLTDQKLNNGYYIASTVLKEAIDPTIPRSHIGMIDKMGNIIIPFGNKTIKQVEGNHLLVVRSEPRSQSVIQAVQSRNDPSSAERMVSTNASIKEKLNHEMNNQGKFIFNDLLGEGTICSLEGENLLNNNYYSFIGMTDDAFFCSTNVVTDSVIKVPRSDVFRVAPVITPVNNPVNTVSNEQPSDVLDVSAVKVPKMDIDQALNSNRETFERPVSLEKPVEQVEEKPIANEPALPSVDTPKVIDDVNLPPISFDKPLASPMLSEVKTESIFDNLAEDSFELDDEKEEEVKEILPSDLNVEAKREDNVDIVDVVHAASDMVRDYKKLQDELKRYKADNERLTEQLRRLPEIEKLNKEYEEQVKELEEKNKNMVAGLEQLKSVLSPNGF